MKFSDFNLESWQENGRYFDTCLIPYTGLQGTENPPEVAAVLERLRDFMDRVEIPFKGRVVTYPALQYAGAESIPLINDICRKVKSSGFQYAVVLSADVSILSHDVYESDLVLSLPVMRSSQGNGINLYISEQIQRMWAKEN